MRFGLSPNDTADLPALTAAWLHDVLEDTDASNDQIEEIFGKCVLDIVYCVTDGEGATRSERKKEVYKKIIANQDAINVKLADRIANVEACFLDGNKKIVTYKGEHSEFVSVIEPHTNTKIGVELLKYLNKLMTF